MAKRTLKQQQNMQEQVIAELCSIAFAQAGDEKDTSLKMTSKLKALELLGRHVGMFTDKVEQKTDGALRIELAEALEELAQ